MASRRLGVRCDIGQQAGVGHLMRCLALAEEFRGNGWEVEVAADVDGFSFARHRLEAAGVPHVVSPRTPTDHASWVSASALDAVLLDTYVLGPEVSRALVDAAPTLAIIDGSTRGQLASMYLDQNFGSEHSMWPPRNEMFASQFPRLAGSAYTVISDDFMALRPPKPPHQDHRADVLVALGGTDPFGYTPLVVEAIIAAQVPAAVTVISTAISDVGLRKGSADVDVKVQAPTQDFPKMVATSSAVLFAAGSSMWEAATLGKPIAAMAVAENQSTTYGALVRNDVIHGLGNFAERKPCLNDLEEPIGVFLRDVELRTRLAKAGFGLIDGQGRSRVYGAFVGLLESGEI